MKELVVIVLTALVATLCLGTAAAAIQVFYDDFSGIATGTYLPAGGWNRAGNVAGTWAQVIDGGGGNKLLDVHDDNPGDTKNNTFSHTFAATTATSGSATGICTAEIDVMLPQTTAGFGISLYNGSTPTSGYNVGCRIVFEGNIAYSDNGGPGKVCYWKQSAAPSYLTVKVLQDGEYVFLTYEPNTWYTLKFVANVITKTYQVFFGPRGGTLAQLLNPETLEPDFPFYMPAAPNPQISQIAGISLLSSIKNGDTAGDMMIDNVIINGDVDVLEAATVLDAKTAANGTYVRLRDKVVTAGTDQLLGGFFYIQEDGIGIRVRPYPPVTVHQGDKVTVIGTLQRASDNGSPTLRSGEKEISGTTDITVTPGPFPFERPVAVGNRRVGGGPWGPLESDGWPAQPGVYAADGTPPDNQILEVGPSNVGRLAKVFGKVLYSNRQQGGTSYFFYIDDGSAVLDGSGFPTFAPGGPFQQGIRVQCMPMGTRLDDIEGKYVLVPCIIGSIAGGDSLIKSGNPFYYNNVRIIRPVEETFTDTNGNYVWDVGEPYVDSNANGVYDGMIFVTP